MGFAKYQEDIVSRYVGDLAMRSTKAPASPPKKPSLHFARPVRKLPD